MHSSRMHTASSLPYGASLSGGPPCTDTPGQRPPWADTPRQRPPWQEHGTRDSRPAWEGIWDQAVRQEVTLYRDPLPSMDRMTRHV